MSQDKESEAFDELLPCPFCGHDDATMTVNEFRDHYITCDNCEADGPWHHTKEAAIAAWNRRAALASQPPAVQGEPLTDEQAEKIIRDLNNDLRGFKGWGWRDVIRATERAHGIHSRGEGKKA